MTGNKIFLESFFSTEKVIKLEKTTHQVNSRYFTTNSVLIKLKLPNVISFKNEKTLFALQTAMRISQPYYYILTQGTT